MRMVKFGRWLFTVSDIKWLEEKALTNELAADILVRYNRRYAVRKPVWLPRRPRLVQ